MADPDMRLSDFRIQSQIASSSGGSVSRALWKRKKLSVALKRRYFPELGQQKDFLHELRLLQRVRHPNVIQCHGGFFSDDGVNFYLVLEFAEHGDLYQRLQRTKRSRQRLSESQVWRIFSQVLSGVACIHSHSIIHRDLKSLNIFQAEAEGAEVFKVGDLGVSRELSQETQFLQTVYGTPLYLSPEQVAHHKYDYKTDMWSLGVLLYECCQLDPPFMADNMLQLARRIEHAQYQPLPECWSQPMVDVVSWLLQKDPARRPAAAQLLAYLDKLFAPKPADGQAPQPAALAPAAVAAPRTREERWEHSRQRLERGAEPEESSPTVPRVQLRAGGQAGHEGRPMSARDQRLEERRMQQPRAGDQSAREQQPRAGDQSARRCAREQQAAVSGEHNVQQSALVAAPVAAPAPAPAPLPVQVAAPAPAPVAAQAPAVVAAPEPRLSARVPAKQPPWEQPSRPMSARDLRLEQRTADRRRRKEESGALEPPISAIAPPPSAKVVLPPAKPPSSAIKPKVTQKRQEATGLMGGQLGLQNEIEKLQQMRRPQSSSTNSRLGTPNILTWE